MKDSVCTAVMRDRDVRAALYRHLAAADPGAWASALVIDELGLCGYVRVDVAVVSETAKMLAGFEIKSAADTLTRLPAQVDMYSRMLDSCTLVVADTHADHARALIPPWWGILVARGHGGAVLLDEQRTATHNPAIAAQSLALLLWRDELVEALQTRGAERGFVRKPRKVLAHRLAEVAELDEIRSLVRERLRGRPRWHRTSESIRTGEQLNLAMTTVTSPGGA